MASSGDLYTLMHGDVVAAEVRIDPDSGLIAKLASVLDPDHMPVGTVHDGRPDIARLKEWWSDRSIPMSRGGVGDLLAATGVSDTRALLPGSLGLCLSDRYWIRPAGSGIGWSEANIFDNPFSEDVGDALFCERTSVRNLRSPDVTTEGNLSKRWRVVGRERVLFKGGTGFGQEPFDEAIAARICEALRISHVDYAVSWVDGRPYSVCPDFITGRTELVTAYRVIMTRRRRNDESLRTHYVKCCADLGIDIVPSLDRMIVLDHIIGNWDRHTNNFGLVRDAETLEWIGPAPIFDSGSSLGCDLPTGEIPHGAGIGSMPFKRRSSDQIGLVTSFDWIDFDALESCYPDLERILDSSRGLIDRERRNAILSFIMRRVTDLRILAG